VLFGVVVRTLASTQSLDSHKIGNVVDYDLPVSWLVAEFDVYTDRYELGILRALRPDTNDSNEIQAASSAAIQFWGRERGGLGGRVMAKS
jgi:adenylate cyclase